MGVAGDQQGLHLARGDQGGGRVEAVAQERHRLLAVRGDLRAEDDRHVRDRRLVHRDHAAGRRGPDPDRGGEDDGHDHDGDDRQAP